MGKSILINSPFIFSAVWSIVKVWIDDKVRENVMILGGGYYKELTKYIDEDMIPECFGGKNSFCGCVSTSPYVMEGKPERPVFRKEEWSFLTPKATKKMERQISEQAPTKQQFFLCHSCKEAYVENNWCKGRRADKIGRNQTSFW